MQTYADKDYNPHLLCLVIYYIPIRFVRTVVGYGTVKSLKLFYTTLPSTVQRIKTDCSGSGPKQVVASVLPDAGGIAGVSYPGELPRNEDQMLNSRITMLALQVAHKTKYKVGQRTC